MQLDQERLDLASNADLASRLLLVESDLRLSPRDPNVHAERCLLLNAIGNEKGAERACKLGLRLCADSPLMWMVAGAVALRANATEVATLRAKEAVRLGPENPASWRLLSAALSEQGARNESIAANRRAKSLELGSNPADLPFRALYWSQHPLPNQLASADAWMDRRSPASKIAVKVASLLPVVLVLTALEVSVANFPAHEAFVLAIIPALILGELTHRVGEAISVLLPHLRRRMSHWSLASGWWTLSLLAVFLGLVLIEGLGHGGGPMVWLPFFTVCAIGALRPWRKALDVTVIHSIGVMSVVAAVYGALITPN